MTMAPLTDRPTAPLWRRVTARMLDLVTVLMIMWVLAVLQIFWFMEDVANATAVEPWGTALFPTLVFLSLAVAYDAIFVRFNVGQTPGKDAMNLRVVGDDDTVSGPSALLRGAAVSVPWLLPNILLAGAVVALGAAAVLISPRAALHDVLVGTRVVAYERSAEDADAPPRPKLVFPGARLLGRLQPDIEDEPGL